MGLATSGMWANGLRRWIIGSISAGPDEQLQPNACTPRLCSVISAASGVVPLSVRTVGSKVMVVRIKLGHISLIAITCALVSWISICVSTANISTPPSRRPFICRLNISTASSKSSSPKGFMNLPQGPMFPATSTVFPALSAHLRDTEASLRFTSSTSSQPYSESL